MASRGKKDNQADVVEFNPALYGRVDSAEWREMKREEDGAVFRVKLASLSIGEAEDIPAALTTEMQECFEHIAPYIEDWNLVGRDRSNGKEVSIPPPAKGGWQTLKLLNWEEVAFIVNQLKFGHLLRRLEEKKESIASEGTSDSQKENGLVTL